MANKQQNGWKRSVIARYPFLAGVLLLFGVIGMEAVIASAQTPSLPTNNTMQQSATTSGSGTSLYGTSSSTNDTTGDATNNSMATSTVNSTTNSTTGTNSTTTSPTSTGTGTSSTTGTSGTTSGTGGNAILGAYLLGTTPAPVTLSVDGKGNTLIRGVVQAAGTDSLTITSWGGTWTIRSGGVGATTIAGGATNFLGVSVGDFVGATGVMSPDQAMTVNASFVRDWTTNPYQSTSAQSSGTGSSTGSTGGSTGGTGTGGSTTPNASSGTSTGL